MTSLDSAGNEHHSNQSVVSEAGVGNIWSMLHTGIYFMLATLFKRVNYIKAHQALYCWTTYITDSVLTQTLLKYENDYIMDTPAKAIYISGKKKKKKKY